MINLFLEEVSAYGAVNQIKSVVLTGGRSVSDLYEEWALSPNFKMFEDATFYFGDERCVPVDHGDCNFRMVSNVFGKSFKNVKLERIKGEAHDLMTEVSRYSNLLPRQPDLAFFSVGEDGHIASIFPNSPVLKSNRRVAYTSKAPKTPAKRITITPRVVRDTKHVIVLAVGAAKGRILASALRNPHEVGELPVRLTIGRTWILDECARDTFFRLKPENTLNTRVIHV